MPNNENELKIQIKYKILSKRFLTLINKIRQDEDLQGEHQIKYLVDYLLLQRTQYVESTSIRCRYYVDMSKKNFDKFSRFFHVFLRGNFDGRKSTLFRRTFSNAISMCKNSTLL